MSVTKAAWARKTREPMNHHMDSTIWNDFEFRDDVARWVAAGELG
jgi:hypothetical protein